MSIGALQPEAGTKVPYKFMASGFQPKATNIMLAIDGNAESEEEEPRL